MNDTWSPYGGPFPHQSVCRLAVVEEDLVSDAIRTASTRSAVSPAWIGADLSHSSSVQPSVRPPEKLAKAGASADSRGE
eukprot:scaffold107580_cov66-Phaeocystis_antarctica.AAC.7